MVSITLCFAGCSQTDSSAGRLDVRPNTSWQQNQLLIESGIEFEPSPAMLEALEHGVALELDVSARISRRFGPIARLQTLEITQYRIRYLPLVEYWQLDVIEADGATTSQSYPRFWLLLDALREPRLYSTGLVRDMLEHGRWQVQIRVELDRTALPAPMQLPSVIESEWRLTGPWHTWLYER